MLTQFSHKSNHCCCIFRTFGPVLSQFSRKMDHCCCSFRTWGGQCCCIFRTFGPVLSQFSRKMDHCCCSFRTWGGQCCCIFRTCENCNNTGGTSLVAIFAQPGLRENCDKTGPPSVVAIFARAKNATTLAPPCAKTATTMVHFARKLQQHWWTSLVAVFARAKIAATLVDQCCCSFRTTRVCVKIAKHWWTSHIRGAGGTILDAFFTHPRAGRDHS